MKDFLLFLKNMVLSYIHGILLNIILSGTVYSVGLIKEIESLKTAGIMFFSIWFLIILWWNEIKHNE